MSRDTLSYGRYNQRVATATYNDLEFLWTSKQSQILLCRLVNLCPSPSNTFFKYNYETMPQTLSAEFPRTEARAVTDLLLGAPWRWLENEGLIRELGSHHQHCVTEKGYEAAKDQGSPLFSRTRKSSLHSRCSTRISRDTRNISTRTSSRRRWPRPSSGMRTS